MLQIVHYNTYIIGSLIESWIVYLGQCLYNKSRVEVNFFYLYFCRLEKIERKVDQRIDL